MPFCIVHCYITSTMWPSDTWLSSGFKVSVSVVLAVWMQVRWCRRVLESEPQSCPRTIPCPRASKWHQSLFPEALGLSICFSISQSLDSSATIFLGSTCREKQRINLETGRYMQIPTKPKGSINAEKWMRGVLEALDISAISAQAFTSYLMFIYWK